MKMKTNLLYFLLPIAALSYSCGDDDEPKSLPTVVTKTPTELTATTAMASGTLSSSGNATITETGFVYSSNVAQPTTADSKTKSTSTTGTFTAKLEGLTSGTTYHLRAYAINEIGTGYGEIIDFATGNAAPVASELSIDGALEVNKTVTAKYKYSDAENNPEGESTLQWYVANDASGAGEAMIAGATAKTLLVQEAQNGKFLRFSITPKAATGTTLGLEVKSPYSTAVGAETVTFAYGGSSVTYGTIISSTTQKKWLDRNLGSTRAAQTVDDYLAYGHFFQWGRSADGHQVIIRTGPSDANATAQSSTTTTKSPTVTAPDSKFVTDSDFGSAGDWLATQNETLWQGVGGVNNPCPAGWRIPTKEEWAAEGITSLANGFDKLKLTYTGYRSVEDGGIYVSASQSVYWTSTTAASDGNNYSVQVRFSDAFYNSVTNRGNGLACRCIKD
jgi:hypothetical protein